MIRRHLKWLVSSAIDGLSHILKDNSDHIQSSEEAEEKITTVETPLVAPHVGGVAGGTRAGLFRTPISGGVQSATSAHGLPRPALAVRNLMEQVIYLCSVT